MAANTSGNHDLAENEAGDIDPALADAIEARLDAIVDGIPFDAPDVPKFDRAKLPKPTTLEAQLYLPLFESAPSISQIEAVAPANEEVLDEAIGDESTIEVSGDQIPGVETDDEPDVSAAGINATMVNKYYYFGEQRIAMRKNGTFYYLHNDHLASTYLSTTSNGAKHATQAYKAFGKYRGGNTLPTDYRFTGQKLDTTGLMYYNARYYDPMSGQFISPDTIVPDPMNLLDYNRYMYVRGNPLKYNDPSGHCTTRVDGEPDWNNDAECWGNATWIKNHWNDTDRWYNEYGYWENRFGSVDIFWDHIANKSSNDNDFMKAQREFYETWRSARDSQILIDLEDYRQHNPSPGRNMTRPCLYVWDCTAMGYDIASFGLSVGGDALAGCTAAIVTAPACGAPAVAVKAADLSITAMSTQHALKQAEIGNASNIDTSISLAANAVSLIPGVGWVAPAISFGWNVIDPIIPEEYLTGTGK